MSEKFIPLNTFLDMIKMKHDDITYMLERKWCTGGAEGGNCWGDEAHGYTTDNEEPEDEIIVEILEQFVPNLTYLEHRKFLKDEYIYESSFYTESQYYGNYDHFSVKTLNLEKLHEQLTKIFDQRS